MQRNYVSDDPGFLFFFFFLRGKRNRNFVGWCRATRIFFFILFSFYFSPLSVDSPPFVKFHFWNLQFSKGSPGMRAALVPPRVFPLRILLNLLNISNFVPFKTSRQHSRSKSKVYIISIPSKLEPSWPFSRYRLF